jgi:hypothetical protein
MVCARARVCVCGCVFVCLCVRARASMQVYKKTVYKKTYNSEAVGAPTIDKYLHESNCTFREHVAEGVFAMPSFGPMALQLALCPPLVAEYSKCDGIGGQL